MNSSHWLSKDECTAMRGIAILGIVLHNFCHWINGPIVMENEFRYRINRVTAMLGAISDIDIYLPVQLISFFGHYGVPVFLFLSGWGLVMKYEHKEDMNVRPLSFIRYNYLKLLRMMIVGFIAYLIVDRMTPGARHYTFDVVVEHLLMVVNFVPNPDRTIHPGPYWFFGIMMQLYVAYIFIFYRFRHWGVVISAIIISFVIQMPKAPDSLDLEWTRYNLFGSILPFGAGLLLARGYFNRQLACLSKSSWMAIFIMSAALVFTMSLNYYSWYIVPIFICLGMMAAIKLLPSAVIRYMIWTGSISSALFVSHPIVRKLFIPISKSGEIYCGILLYIIAAIGIAWVIKMITDKIPSPRLGQ